MDIFQKRSFCDVEVKKEIESYMSCVQKILLYIYEHKEETETSLFLVNKFSYNKY